MGDERRKIRLDPESTDGSLRLMRGGSWFFGYWFCRSVYRDQCITEYRNLNHGFRLTLATEDATDANDTAGS